MTRCERRRSSVFLRHALQSLFQPVQREPRSLNSSGLFRGRLPALSALSFFAAVFIIAGIRFVGNSAQGGDFLVARYNSNGTLDRTFGQRGQVITDLGLTEQAAAVAVQPDGKVIIAGGTYDLFPASGGQYVLVRYNSNGTLDTTFGVAGVVTTFFGTAGFGRRGLAAVDFGSFGQSARSVLLQTGGKIVAVGYADTESSRF
jgi:uncharacterized delta-60 repeat protein